MSYYISNEVHLKWQDDQDKWFIEDFIHFHNRSFATSVRWFRKLKHPNPVRLKKFPFSSLVRLEIYQTFLIFAFCLEQETLVT